MSEDFNPHDISKTIDNHAKDLKDIDKRLNNLEQQLGSDYIVNTLNCRIKESTTISSTISDILQKLLSSDNKTKNNLKLVVEDVNKNIYKILIGKFGAVIIVFLTLLADALIKKYIG